VQQPPFVSRDTAFTFTDFQSEIFTWYADGVGVDLTGCSAALSFRVAPDDAEPILVASTITLGTTAGGNAGQVSYTIARAQLEALAPPVPALVRGDLLITETDGKVIEFAHIELAIAQGSTY
jgi:hypothetical protein